MRWINFVAATAVLELAVMAGGTAGGAEPDWPSPTVGGTGGETATSRCPRGHHVIGFVARVGADLDAIGVVCSEGVSDGSRRELSGGRPIGGRGGTPSFLLCPESAPFVRELRISAEGESTVVVNQVSFDCGPLVGPMPRLVNGYNRLGVSGEAWYSESPIHAQNPTYIHDTFSCPDGMALVGVHGRTGALVDALGVVCGAVVLAPVSPVTGGLGELQQSAATDPFEQLFTGGPHSAWSVAGAGAGPMAGADRPLAPAAPGGERGGGAAGPGGCQPGFVPRFAGPADTVCVTQESHDRAVAENAAAPSRRDPAGAYGPSTCVAGFVWREAYAGDVVCVVPEVRAMVRAENRLASSRAGRP